MALTDFKLNTEPTMKSPTSCSQNQTGHVVKGQRSNAKGGTPYGITCRRLIIALTVLACSVSWGTTYYISQASTGVYDGLSIPTAYTNITHADASISYTNYDVIRIDAGTNGDNIGYGYQYTSGGPQQFSNLSIATNANNITIEGINGIPMIVTTNSAIEARGVRYGFTIRRLFVHAQNRPAIIFWNSSDDPYAAPASTYPASGADNVVANCVISNTAGGAAIWYGTGNEDGTTRTVIDGNTIVSNRTYATAGINGEGAIRSKVHGTGYGLTITYNDIAGDVTTLPGLPSQNKGIIIHEFWGVDTDHFIAYNRIHNWPSRCMKLDVSGSEIRENLIWDCDVVMLEADWGLGGGLPNLYVNNTFFNGSYQYENRLIDINNWAASTNWFINNIVVSNAQSGYAFYGNQTADQLLCCSMTYDVGSPAYTGMSEVGTNYWNRDPVFSSTDPSSATFLMPTMVSGNPAVDGGTNMFGGKSYIGAVYPIPEPALVSGIVMLAACLRRR